MIPQRCMAVFVVLTAVLLWQSAAAKDNVSNSTCPVMIGEKVNPNIFVEYRGRKVYLCCKFCKAAFMKNPGKYVGNLPPLAATAAKPSSVHAGNGHDSATDPVDHDNSEAGNEEHGHGRGILTFLGKFHPVAVHFPIALIIIALVAEILFMVTGKELFQSSATFLLPAGAVGAILATALGWLAARDAGFPGPLSNVLEQHRWFGIGAMVASSLAALIQFFARKNERPGRRVGAGIDSHFGRSNCSSSRGATDDGNELPEEEVTKNTGTSALHPNVLQSAQTCEFISKATLSWAYRALLVVAVGLIAWVGHLGGSLVYGIDYFKLNP